jgi:hypothetical protein
MASGCRIPSPRDSTAHGDVPVHSPEALPELVEMVWRPEIVLLSRVPVNVQVSAVAELPSSRFLPFAHLSEACILA